MCTLFKEYKTFYTSLPLFILINIRLCRRDSVHKCYEIQVQKQLLIIIQVHHFPIPRLVQRDGGHLDVILGEAYNYLTFSQSRNCLSLWWVFFSGLIWKSSNNKTLCGGCTCMWGSIIKSVRIQDHLRCSLCWYGDTSAYWEVTLSVHNRLF